MTKFFHCDYGFNLIFFNIPNSRRIRIWWRKGKLKINKFLNVYNSIQNKDLFFKYKISLIKSKFIRFFNINTEVKLKFKEERKN